jgi:cytochrome c oxidase assembly protein Cox11
MDRKLARKNLRTAFITTAVIAFMFGISYVAAWLYNL